MDLILILTDDYLEVERLRRDVGDAATPRAAQITRVGIDQVGSRQLNALVEAGILLAEVREEYRHRSLLVFLARKVA